MLDKNYLLPVDALRLILNSIHRNYPSDERLKIEECYGRIIALDVISTEDLPAFYRSTVDGYALNSTDTFGATDTLPTYFIVENEVTMGDVPAFKLKKGEAAKIPTGGMLPAGADAVVMLEHANAVSDNMVEVLRPAAPNENVIQKGEDITRGEIVLTKGHRLRAQDIGAVAGLGITETKVFKKPVVSIISTGDEIVPANSSLHLGQVRDINSFTLEGLINEHGGRSLKKGIFRDEYETIRNVIEESLHDSDMVLIIGGTSAGIKDMTADIINDIGRNYTEKSGLLFHGLLLKPGKPMIGGVVKNIPILGLPGHPVAMVTCFDLFIMPLMERLSGVILKGERFLKVVRAKMAKNIASAAGREDHIRVCLEEREGELSALPILGKSGLINTLVKADGIVVIPPGKLGLDSGEEVTVRLF